MIWVVVVGALALAGVVALVIHAVSLGHKAADVKAEITVLNERRAELRTLLGQLERTPAQRD
ncbi:hypothetical protein ACX1DX_05065 [Tessaracoccus sp. Y36]|uniref:hypothetical protein n=1 Tax=Tessaracoccus sp. ZS01 TaxID=1906324 RepID=UPI00096E6431|nr:hypothetical protein [Tessaracoccus sp. ZS01]MCG6566273.1 hypothetical protein [Tessaracoccus sp. ZS01]OMG58749.1 hypothetical protein BJN44_01305 [Tessaracoccus sp. ZS01]